MFGANNANIEHHKMPTLKQFLEAVGAGVRNGQLEGVVPHPVQDGCKVESLVGCLPCQ